MSDVLELFTYPTYSSDVHWGRVFENQHCHYLGKKCDKTRKSDPSIAIGTCTMDFGVRSPKDIIICPWRFRERNQLFLDSIHLLKSHEPGNELHVIPEQQIPGGNVDYFLVSAFRRKVVDFVGIEVQALDSTGTAWPIRQAFLKSKGVHVEPIREGDEDKGFGMNWKHTAKTTLVQLHHKVETFEHVGKHLVLVLQDSLLEYMQNEFSFDHCNSPPRAGDTMHFHAYRFCRELPSARLELATRISTDSSGVAKALGIQANPRVELQVLLEALEASLSDATLLKIG